MIWSGSAGGGKQRRSDLEEGEEVDDGDEDDGNDENKNKRKLVSCNWVKEIFEK